MLAAFSLLATGLVATSLTKAMFQDEAATLYAARLPWPQLWHHTRVVDAVFTLYYAFMHLWLSLSGTIAWARTPSLLAYGTTVYLVGCLGAKRGSVWCGALAAFLVASNATLIDAALLARPYALTALVTTCALTMLDHWLSTGRRSHLIWFLIWCSLDAGLHLFAALAPLAALAGALVSTYRQKRAQWHSSLVPLATFGVLLVVYAGVLASQVRQISWVPRATLLGSVVELLGPLLHATGMIDGVIVAAVAFTAVCVIALGLHRRANALSRAEWDDLVMLFSWTAVPGAVLVVVSFKTPVYVHRYLTDTTPGLALLVAVLVTHAVRTLRLRGPWPLRSLVVASGLLIASIVPSAASVVASVIQPTQQVAAFVGRHVGSGEVVLQGYIEQEWFDYYHPSNAPHWPLRRGLVSPDETEIDMRPIAFRSARPNLWVVVEHANRTMTTFAATLVHDGYRLVETKVFERATVFHFVKAQSVGLST